uniref:Uncharacterized protein n=1 Tax=Onchocerca volvulus TaxID=6282 RepID=A0A8R1TJI4_ONCVO
MNRKATETTFNINGTFGKLLTWCNEKFSFKKFCERDENLEDEKCNNRISEVNTGQLSTYIEIGLLQLRAKFPKNLASAS